LKRSSPGGSEAEMKSCGDIEAEMNKQYKEADKAAAANEVGLMGWYNNQANALAKKLEVAPRPTSEAVKTAIRIAMNNYYDSAQKGSRSSTKCA